MTFIEGKGIEEAKKRVSAVSLLRATFIPCLDLSARLTGILSNVVAQLVRVLDALAIRVLISSQGGFPSYPDHQFCNRASTPSIWSSWRGFPLLE
jgi:hypothetical protein